MSSGPSYQSQDDVPKITEEKVDTIPFPSLTETGENLKLGQSSTSPESNATVSSALTLSDKLSALPQSVTSPNLNNRGGRSPLINQSPRLFRHSLDASKSWPNVSSPNRDSLGSSSQPLNNNTWNSPRPRASASEGSLERETPRQRVSFESERTSTMHGVRQAFTRLNRGSDPTAPSPALRASAAGDYALRDQPESASNRYLGSASPSHSASRSRATSPLRILHQWSAGLHRPHTRHEEPFVPVNPYRSQFRFQMPSFPCIGSRSSGGLPHQDTELPTVRVSTTVYSHTSIHDLAPLQQRAHDTQVFFGDTLPRFIYLHMLLRIPSMYFSRVARIFEDAEVSRPDIQRMIEACGRGGSHFLMTNGLGPGAAMGTGAGVNGQANANSMAAGIASATNLAAAAASVVDLPLPLPEEWSTPLVSPALVRFKLSWEAFIDSLMREWKTLNLVSALLLSAILTMFQIPDAASDPLTRTAALISLICSLMSLSYGCMYIVRFGTMRSMYRASRWAEEAQKSKTLLWWNVWVLLAMPAVWLSWSMISFIVSILSFVWRTGSTLDPDERSSLSPLAALGPRIAITSVFLLGMVYFFLIVKALQSYGSGGVPKGERRMYVRPEDVHVRANERGRTEDHTVRRAANGVRGAEDRDDQEHRGRERQRDVYRSVRRREEGVKGRTSFKGSNVQAHPRGDVFGLGLTGLGGSGVDNTIEMDMEKLDV